MTGEGRLVRDVMREKINRVTPYTRPVADASEQIRALIGKLIEETGEVVDAVCFDGDVIGELADVMQVVFDIADFYGVAPGDVDAARRAKYAQKGGFHTMLAWRQPDE